MSLPKWLAQEVDELARRVKRGELDREQAVETLRDDARKKDDAWVDSVVIATLSGKLDNAVRKLRRAASNEVARIIAPDVQGSFDEICSDFWPRDTFGPETTLEDLERHAEEMRALTKRFDDRDKERDRRLTELIHAAGGDKKTSWEKAERLRLGLSGGAAAEG